VLGCNHDCNGDSFKQIDQSRAAKDDGIESLHEKQDMYPYFTTNLILAKDPLTIGGSFSANWRIRIARAIFLAYHRSKKSTNPERLKMMVLNHCTENKIGNPHFTTNLILAKDPQMIGRSFARVIFGRRVVF